MVSSDEPAGQESLEPIVTTFKVTMPTTLYERVENAAYWEGYDSISKLVCIAVRQWINQKEEARPDGQFPKSLDKRRRGPRRNSSTN